MKLGWLASLEALDDTVKIVCLVKPSEIKKLKISVPHPNFMAHRLKVMTVILAGALFLTSRRKQIRR